MSTGRGGAFEKKCFQNGGLEVAALYLMEQGAVVRKVDQRVVVELEGRTVQDIPLIKIDQVVIFGRVTVTAAATAMFLEHGIEVVYLTAYGKFLGRLQPPAPKNCLLRVAQYRASLDGAASALLAAHLAGTGFDGRISPGGSGYTGAGLLEQGHNQTGRFQSGNRWSRLSKR